MGKSAPIVDSANGGSLVAYPETLRKALAAIRNVKWVIPGHDLPPVDRKKAARSGHAGGIDMAWNTWDDLREFADFNQDFLAAVQEARAAGKTIEQASTDLKRELARKYKDYDMDRVNANVQLTYTELRGK